MIELFNIPKYKIPFKKFDNILTTGVREFENKFAEYVGAKYACGVNSATNAIFLSLLNKNVTVQIPTMVPPVVVNAIIHSNNKYKFIDDPFWIGHSYVLHDFKDYKIIDSAQQVIRDQFLIEANPNDLMIFSFYPTKPVSGIDGGMIVSDDAEKIHDFRILVNNGASLEVGSWNKRIITPGYKMYLSAAQAFIANKSLDILEKKSFVLSTFIFHVSSLSLMEDAASVFAAK